MITIISIKRRRPAIVKPTIPKILTGVELGVKQNPETREMSLAPSHENA